MSDYLQIHSQPCDCAFCGAERKLQTELAESQSHDVNVICPYCRSEYQAEAESYTEREVEEVCDKCGRTYLRCDDFSVTHNTRALPNKLHRKGG